MERAALFFDVDGTILSEVTKTIPQSALDALGKARANGHLLFINTGRPYCELPKEVLDAPFDGFLCGCGTCLVSKGEILFQRSLTVEMGDRILDRMEECHVEGICEATLDMYFPRRISRFRDLEAIRSHFGKWGLGKERYQEERGFVYDKLLVYTDAQSRTQDFLAWIGQDMDVIDREEGRFEIVPKGFSKATACAYVLERFGVPWERCYVFGDSSNDLSMFTYAPHGIAMGNHSPLLEPYTEYVTSAVEEDGIARALQEYGFL